MMEEQLLLYENGRKRARMAKYFELDAHLVSKIQERKLAGLSGTGNDLNAWSISFTEAFVHDESSPEERKAVYRNAYVSQQYV